MKKYAIYSFLAVATVLSVFLMAFNPNDKATTNNPGNYILVEIYEFQSYKDKGIHIHYGGNKREIIPFKDFTAENHDDNGDIILNSINKLLADGYVIESTCAGLSEGGMLTKIFMKRK